MPEDKKTTQTKREDTISVKCQNLIRNIESNTRELQCITGKMKCNTRNAQTLARTLLHDKDALVNSTIQSHRAEHRMLDKAWLTLCKKSYALSDERKTFASYRTLQLSDTDRNQRNLLYFNRFSFYFIVPY